ncbi:DUF7662 domain-containing protein [Paenibacillus ginsengarvi]|uniref:DUF7662 domain-containing protein n=1 Tax=Paenibacillus ginsengarvi TaxID=400777 RepID=A0A3B0BK23_9BACL|nr:hypothetical protein [Paenibacillus ginsengarvi]RKN74173.1 hypothetical protein D7M11_27375 [Paenibacillus ginsengarvi]
MKYTLLEKFLKQKATITLTYSEIEHILGIPLPQLAYKHRSWWGNQPEATQALAWLRSGWLVDSVELGASVTFVRSGE